MAFGNPTRFTLLALSPPIRLLRIHPPLRNQLRLFRFRRCPLSPVVQFCVIAFDNDLKAYHSSRDAEWFKAAKIRCSKARGH
jgi:hypothetical protein